MPRRENSAAGWGEPRDEVARAPLVRRDPTLVYTPNGVLDMTRRRVTPRVQAWRVP